MALSLVARCRCSNHRGLKYIGSWVSKVLVRAMILWSYKITWKVKRLGFPGYSFLSMRMTFHLNSLCWSIHIESCRIVRQKIKFNLNHLQKFSIMVLENFSVEACTAVGPRMSHKCVRRNLIWLSITVSIKITIIEIEQARYSRDFRTKIGAIVHICRNSVQYTVSYIMVSQKFGYWG